MCYSGIQIQYPSVFGLAGLTLELLCCNPVFVANFYLANKSPNFKTIA